ncbi:MAG: class I SAM-dependent methyltransferase [Verrucomicrobiales bacterium]|nr:MAG: class I SAM-dependent methyltransferase [Verrucomicrobiales bacterium]
MPATMIERAEKSHPGITFKNEAEWLRCVKDDFPKFIPFLTRHCSLDIRGRVLEIGAGSGWFSAELSKLPLVVEIVTTDVSAKLLKNEAPKIFKLLRANEAKITRTPSDFENLGYPANHFHGVVCSDALHHSANMLRVLREVKRVLKPGGTFIAIREPVRPLVKLKSRKGKTSETTSLPGCALSEYRDYFEAAGLKLTVKRVVLSRGFKYYFDKVVNGFTHARYAFVATKSTK